MFHDHNNFPWTASLIEHWRDIRSEYDRIATQTIPWPEAIHNGLWSVFGIVQQGRDLNVKHLTPMTANVCDVIPGIHTYGFSILKPGCEIRTHKGYTSKVLRCHLGLYTDPNAAIMVADETSSWQDGKVLVFDDTKHHSAWNRGSADRVILLIDFMK
jgi:beta-hydroxylase